MKDKRKSRNLASHPSLIDAQTKLKSLDITTKVLINGHEITMAEYMSDPKKYNSIKMSDEYIKQIEAECEKAKKEKEIFKCNPTLASGYRDVN